MGLKGATTGDTLADEKQPVLLEVMKFPEPVIAMAIEPKTKPDQEKMGFALQKLAQEDPSFRVRTDEETAQTIIAGMGELHLEIIVDRLLREFKVEANVGKPEVAFRETIRRKAESESKYIKQTGGRGQYGHGGGEGKSGQGNPHPVSPWGLPTKGYKTRQNKKTEKYIIARRKSGVRNA